MQATETHAGALAAERWRHTWAAIHHAAADATIERGRCDVTVAQIAEAAGVSPRTFFNYFESKEDAILGVRTPQLTAETLSALRESTDREPLLRVAVLLAEVARSTIGPGVDMPRRREIAASDQVLASRLTQVFTDSRKYVISRMVDDVDQPWPGVEGLPTDPDEARALILLAHAAVIHAWMSDVDRLFTDRDAALAEAIHTLRKVMSTP